jgi:MYXO-CTERM domain-containing protein
MIVPADAWEMNYYVDGEIGGPIRFEIDNTALHLWATAVHAAALSPADRAAFLQMVWPTDQAALDLLVRWKESDTDLPAGANEDDNLAITSTLHGAVAVYAGLVAGARLAHAVGDDDHGRTYLDRANALKSAIDTAYYDPVTMLFRAARGLPGGPHDTIAGWDTGWLVWPARFFASDDPRQEVQLSSDMDGILAILRGQTQPGGTYTAKNVLAAALYGKDGGARDKAKQAVALLAQIATTGTDSFGEVYMPQAGTAGAITWSNRTATPHVWEGALFYLSAMALTNPQLFNQDETALPLPPPAGCGCSSDAPAGTAAAPLVLVALAWRKPRSRRRARDVTRA